MTYKKMISHKIKSESLSMSFFDKTCPPFSPQESRVEQRVETLLEKQRSGNRIIQELQSIDNKLCDNKRQNDSDYKQRDE